MSLFVVKVKDKELYFNVDEGNGEFVCNTPMVMDETQANDVLKYCSELYDMILRQMICIIYQIWK